MHLSITLKGNFTFFFFYINFFSNSTELSDFSNNLTFKLTEKSFYDNNEIVNLEEKPVDFYSLYVLFCIYIISLVLILVLHTPGV
jgi:hypothetical protein